MRSNPQYWACAVLLPVMILGVLPEQRQSMGTGWSDAKTASHPLRILALTNKRIALLGKRKKLSEAKECFLQLQAREIKPDVVWFRYRLKCTSYASKISLHHGELRKHVSVHVAKDVRFFVFPTYLNAL
jgi:pentatricopeptide repeat protein